MFTRYFNISFNSYSYKRSLHQLSKILGEFRRLFERGSCSGDEICWGDLRRKRPQPRRSSRPFVEPSSGLSEREHQSPLMEKYFRRLYFHHINHRSLDSSEVRTSKEVYRSGSNRTDGENRTADGKFQPKLKVIDADCLKYHPGDYFRLLWEERNFLICLYLKVQ